MVDLDHCKFCYACIPIYEEKLDKDRIHQFLLGLNEYYRSIRTQILALDHLPIMSKVFCLVVQEEKQQCLLDRDKGTDRVNGESTTFFAKKVGDQEKNDERGMFTKSGKKLDTRFYCDNCKYYGYTRKECWHLIGYPNDNKEPKKSKKEKKEAAKKAKLEVANQESTSQTHSLNNEEIQLIKDLISKGKQVRETDWTG